MKFFIDTANLEEIQEANDLGVLDGVTTNPSLCAKVGVRDFEGHIKKICDIVEGDVSAEVVSTTYNEMVEEGLKIAKIADNVVVKVPLIKDGIKACDTCPAFDAWYNGVYLSYFGSFFYPAFEQTADDAFMHKCIAGIQVSTGGPLGHSCRCTGPAG